MPQEPCNGTCPPEGCGMGRREVRGGEDEVERGGEERETFCGKAKRIIKGGRWEMGNPKYT